MKLRGLVGLALVEVATIVGCATDASNLPEDDSGTGSDGSRDASGDARSGNDSGNKDSSPGDSSSDSSDLDSSVDDGASDADDGSSADADDGSGIDSGLVCPLCKKGLACCTITTSFNYGKCYNPACLACCM